MILLNNKITSLKPLNINSYEELTKLKIISGVQCGHIIQDHTDDR